MDALTTEQYTNPWWTNGPKPETDSPTQYLMRLERARELEAAARDLDQA